MREINKVLITGITGFVGSHLADYVPANFPKVLISGLARWRSPTDNIRCVLPESHFILNLNKRYTGNSEL